MRTKRPPTRLDGKANQVALKTFGQFSVQKVPNGSKNDLYLPWCSALIQHWWLSCPLWSCPQKSDDPRPGGGSHQCGVTPSCSCDARQDGAEKPVTGTRGAAPTRSLRSGGSASRCGFLSRVRSRDWATFGPPGTLDLPGKGAGESRNLHHRALAAGGLWRWLDHPGRQAGALPSLIGCERSQLRCDRERVWIAHRVDWLT